MGCVGEWGPKQTNLSYEYYLYILHILVVFNLSA